MMIEWNYSLKLFGLGINYNRENNSLLIIIPFFFILFMFGGDPIEKAFDFEDLDQIEMI